MNDLSAEQYKTLIKQGSDAVSIVSEDGTIRYQSPNTFQIKGWEPEELVGENIFEYIHPDDRSRVTDEFRSLVGTQGHIEKQIEFRFRTKNRGWVWLETTGTSPGPETPIDGYITTSRDISARKRREQQIAEQRDNLELLNQVLRHDLRNDLQVVTGRLAMVSGHVDESEVESLQTARESAEHAIELTTTAREMAEVMLTDETNTQSVELQPTLGGVVENVRAGYPDATVTVEGEIPPVTVTATEMLSSVFDNLLTNAIQHNDKPTAKVTVSAVENEETVTIRIADNGPGVPDDQKDQIFGKGDTGLESSGTGIGLYLVHRLVEIYGGDVWVEDNDPEGSVFAVELPTTE
jgi:PAS domain S-box-containing protein